MSSRASSWPKGKGCWSANGITEEGNYRGNKLYPDWHGNLVKEIHEVKYKLSEDTSHENETFTEVVGNIK